jgi:hypothetical protein
MSSLTVSAFLDGLVTRTNYRSRFQSLFLGAVVMVLAISIFGCGSNKRSSEDVTDSNSGEGPSTKV